MKNDEEIELNNEEENVVAICGPADGHQMTKGKEVECSKCSSKIWLSDSTIRRVKEESDKPPIVICIPCGIDVVKVADHIMPMSSEQWEEIKTILTPKSNPS
jgi:DNA-directed RNA polymerase subunit RPC12/RpoP